MLRPRASGSAPGPAPRDLGGSRPCSGHAGHADGTLRPPPRARRPRSPRQARRPRRPRLPRRGHAPARRWASYPGVHRPHGPLSDRRLAELPGPNRVSAESAEGGPGAVESAVSALPTGSRTPHSGGVHDARLGPAPSLMALSLIGPLRAHDPDVHADAGKPRASAERPVTPARLLAPEGCVSWWPGEQRASGGDPGETCGCATAPPRPLPYPSRRPCPAGAVLVPRS